MSITVRDQVDVVTRRLAGPLAAPAEHGQGFGTPPPVGPTGESPTTITQRNNRSSVLRVVLLGDAIAAGSALVLARLTFTHGGIESLRGVAETLAYLPLVLLVMAAYGMYRRSRRRLLPSTFPDLGRLAHSVLASMLLLFISGHQLRLLLGLWQPDVRSVVLGGVLLAGLVPLARMLTRRVNHRHRVSRVMVIGSGLVADHVIQRLCSTPGLDVVGLVDDTTTRPALDLRYRDVPMVGQLADAERLVRELQVDHVVVAFSPANESEVAERLRCLAGTVQISVVPRMLDLLTVRSTVDDFAGLPVMDVAPAELGLPARAAKRLLDLVVSGTAILVLSPLLAAVAIAIRLDSPGPIIFRQVRTGRGGRPFVIMKFRTMRTGADSERQQLAGANEVDGPLFKIHEDPRVTRAGRFLRRTSLDELPQLFNVFIGDMSLVGPRPLVTAEAQSIDGWAARRYAVRPGMTGLWQISGRNDLPFTELCRIDYCYVASWSLWWDLRILWHTPASVLGRRGAY